MTDLIQHIVKPIIGDAKMNITVEEGETALFIDLTSSDEVAALLNDNNAHYLKTIQHLISVSCGSKKPIVRLNSTSDAQVENSPESDDQ